jgi:hypothetical protein
MPSFKLAHQLIAALMNIDSGASAPANVVKAIDDAQDLLKAEDIFFGEEWEPDKNPQANSLASLLASYNEGRIGPGHCSD